MPLSTGDTLGPYEILALIGAGGMGEVYKARDTRLDRLVAVKTSKTEFSERFAREARAVAALNHPNICQVYDLGVLPGGGSYLVMEFIDGSPIASVDSPRKLLDLAVQMADGMAAAHAAGFTHRDLKPDNILITGPRTPHPGLVKILDFGLARYVSPLPASGATEALTALTNPGTVMGTLPYMSPEQARGEEVDARSDQFSFGLIVYELVARRRAFARSNAAESMAAIIRDEAEPLPPSVPAPLRWTVERCLSKDPTERYESTKDLHRELKQAREHLAEGSGSDQHMAHPAPSRPLRRRWGIAALAAVAGVSIGMAGGRLLFDTPEPPSWTGAMLGGPEIALDSRLSPDGSLLAFQAFDRGLNQVAVMKPETGNWSILTHNRDHGPIQSVAWSRDGASIYYDRGTDVPLSVYSVPVLGGDEHLVLENAAFPEPLPDGSLLVARINAERKPQLFRFWPDSGRLQDFPVMTPAFGLRSAARALPAGKQAVVYGARTGLENQGVGPLILDLDSGASRPLLPASAPESAVSRFAVTRDGRYLLAAVPAGSLVRIVSIPINGSNSEQTRPQTLFTVANQVWHLDSAPDGSVYMSLIDEPVDLVRRPLNGGQSERIASFQEVRNETIAVLPDGRVIVSARTGGHPRLVVANKGKDPVPLSSTAEETLAPMTAVGLRDIAFVIGPAPHQTIAIAETSNGRITRRIPLNKGEITSLASSPDGRTLYCAAGGIVWAVPVPLNGDGAPRMIRAGDTVTADPSGRHLVISVVDSSKFRLFRVSTEGGSEQEIVMNGFSLQSGSLSPNALNADGRLLAGLVIAESWFNPPGLLDTTTGRITRLASDDVSDYPSIAWLPDGRILATHQGLRSTLWRFQPRK